MTAPVDKRRRKVLFGALAAGALATAALIRPNDIGKNHSSYFLQLGKALHQAQLSSPTLVIDKTRLKENIATLKKAIGHQYDYRVVAKSLPSLPLIKEVMSGAQTQRVMVFHDAFLSQITQAITQADVLMGKPMPVSAAATFYTHANTLASHFDAKRQLQWLVDTVQRLRQYQQLAQQLGISLRINIELDVGLHRGGIQDEQTLVDMLKIIDADKQLSFSGFMGYEPHVAKIPGNKLAARDKAMNIYAKKVAIAQQVLGQPLPNVTLNSAGSTTYRYYLDGSFPPNELAAGSCLVKPSDFDLPTLTDHQPAAFIATPVLKAMDKTTLPGVPLLGRLMAAWNPNRAKTFFTYGGYWKTQPESPQGLATNPIFGRSSNQEMYNGSTSISLKADDWMFLRPTQSEAVFSQFGDIAIYEQGQIVDYWPVLTPS